MGGTQYSVDRPRFFALVVSATPPHGVFRINDIENLEVSKRDDGSVGSWSFSMPLVKEYREALTSSGSHANRYAQVAGPMDLVAIYAWRNTAGFGSDEQQNPVSALGGHVGQIAYGDDSAKSVTALGLPTCLMIGMVDGSHISKGYTGSSATCSVNGSDLTKIFTVNDTAIPDQAFTIAVTGKVPRQGHPDFYGLTALNLSKQRSGPTFLVDALDLLVTKDLTKLAKTTNDPTNLPDKKTVDEYAGFGYPWRNFIRTDALDFHYQPLTGPPNAYQPYSTQAGPIWSSLLEIRNPPISRMFVNPLGQLIYDDSYHAWVQQPIAGEIHGDVIRDFESGFDDSTLVTFLAIIPGRLFKDLTTAEIKGQNTSGLQTGSGFVNGIAAAANIAGAHIKTYGYRFGSHTSEYDIGFGDAARRQHTYLQQLNNLFSATLTVKGDARYRIGQRYTVLEQSGRPETTNKTWYVESLSHSCQFGNDWTTVLGLKFPHGQTYTATSSFSPTKTK